MLSVLEESGTLEDFDLSTENPYMLLIAPVRENLASPWLGDYRRGPYRNRKPGSQYSPGNTHVDYSARVQDRRSGRRAGPLPASAGV